MKKINKKVKFDIEDQNQNENDNYQEEVEQYDQVSTFDIDYRIEGFVS